MDMELIKLIADIKARNVQMESLIDLIFDAAGLSYDKKRLVIKDSDAIMAFIKAIEPDAYIYLYNTLMKIAAEEEAEKKAKEEALAKKAAEEAAIKAAEEAAKSTIDENIDYCEELHDICKRYNLNITAILEKHKLNESSSQQEYYDAFMLVKDEVGE